MPQWTWSAANRAHVTGVSYRHDHRPSAPSGALYSRHMSRPTQSNGETERMGTVTCPSGTLVLLDGGLAWMWSHLRPPLLPDWSEVAKTANSSVDIAVRGRDALEAGRLFDRSNHPLFVYDIPREGVAGVRESFAKLCSEHRLQATLAELPERVPHRKRVESLLRLGGAGGAVEFHGKWAIVARGLPAGTELPVVGQRMPSGPDEGRWRRVTIEIRPGETARSEQLGHVLVDEARLLACDVEALGAWDDHTPQDGLVDVVFWGPLAAGVASEVGAGSVRNAGEEDLWGWLDLPLEEALERRARVRALRSEEREFGLDFRPHTQHWELMRQVRGSPTDSGVLDLHGSRVCLFMTSWGDGGFPVHADWDAAGNLLRVRVEVGDPVIVDRQRRVEERWFGEFAKMAFVSAKVAREGLPVRFMYRERPDRERDSGWRVFAGVVEESQEYLDDASNCVLMPLRELLERDPKLEGFFRTPPPCAFERKSASGPFLVVDDFTPES